MLGINQMHVQKHKCQLLLVKTVIKAHIILLRCTCAICYLQFNDKARTIHLLQELQQPLAQCYQTLASQPVTLTTIYYAHINIYYSQPMLDNLQPGKYYV